MPNWKQLQQLLKKEATDSREALQSGSWWHSIDLGDGYITPGVHTVEELRDNYARFNLPTDLTGKRVLDVGCWDGFYSFEAERHGAEVVAIDCFRPKNFFLAHKALNSKVEFHEMSVYELSRKRLGRFDIVLFLGVLYHLRHPLLGLEQLAQVTQDLAIIESHVTDDLFQNDRPIMEFYELDELGGQYDNWWGPNTECVIGMVRAAGFIHTEVPKRGGTRLTIKAYHRSPDPVRRNTLPSIYLWRVENAVTLDNCIPVAGQLAFIALYVRDLPENTTRDSIRVYVDGFETKAIFVGNSGHPGFKQLNAPVPPGLDPGTATVQIETGTQRSNEIEVQLIEGSQW